MEEERENLRIIIYRSEGKDSIDYEELKAYLISKTGISVELRDSFISFRLTSCDDTERFHQIERLASSFAEIRVTNVNQRISGRNVLPGEVLYEKKRLSSTSTSATGMLYDGEYIQCLFRDLIPRNERALRFCHIIFTNQLFGSFDDTNKRYHARVSIYGFPNLISTTGIIEAPAKPREFYLLKGQLQMLGGGSYLIEEAKKALGDRILTYNDRRMTEVMKGYAMQAILYHLTGDPFCHNPDCRLFNAHWQEEVIRAQIKNGEREFCEKHELFLKKIKEIWGKH